MIFFLCFHVYMENVLGLYQYDPDGKKAEAVEGAIGIPVVRHGKLYGQFILNGNLY